MILCRFPTNPGRVISLQASHPGGLLLILLPSCRIPGVSMVIRPLVAGVATAARPRTAVICRVLALRRVSALDLPSGDAPRLIPTIIFLGAETSPGAFNHLRPPLVITKGTKFALSSFRLHYQNGFEDLRSTMASALTIAMFFSNCADGRARCGLSLWRNVSDGNPLMHMDSVEEIALTGRER